MIARLRPEGAADAATLLEVGPPYELAAAGVDRHTVYLSGQNVVLVFEGPEIEAGAEDLADVLPADARVALDRWHELLDAADRGRPARGRSRRRDDG